jgi:hypothetical protein
MFFAESMKMTDFVLSTLFLAPESTESGIFVLWKRYGMHRCRNIRDSAAQSRLRSSSQGLLCLL